MSGGCERAVSTQTFPLAPVLSAYQNRLLCNLDEYRQFLDYMAGTSIPLWDVATVRREVVETLREQLPELAKVSRVPDKTDNGTAIRYVRVVARELGCTEVALQPMANQFTTRTLSEAIK